MTKEASIAFLTLSVLLSGCKGSESDLMPLDVGHTWNYTVKAPDAFAIYVVAIKVARQISVAGVSGVELTSDLGPSRLAWSGDALVTERLLTTQFRPPLPLLYKSEETHERPWKGQIDFVDVHDQVATGVQSQKGDDDLAFGGKKIHCIRSTVDLQTQAHKYELITWFSSGIGIVQQEQRRDDVLMVRLSLLDLK